MIRLQTPETWEIWHQDSDFQYFKTASEEQPVLIKVMRQTHPTWEESAVLRDEFDRAKSLGDGQALQPIGFTQYANRAVLIWPFVNQTPLVSFLSQPVADMALFLKRAIAIVQSVASLHQAGCAHYQLNPNAIWFVDHSVYLSDLNRVQALKAQVTHPWTNRYLPYQAPEQSGRTAQTPDYRADFYALGCLFYQLLTGQIPFNGEDPAAMVHAHLTQAAVPCHQWAPNVPSPLSELVHVLLSKSPDQRYQSSYGLLQDLNAALSHVSQHGNLTAFFVKHQAHSHQFRLSPRLYGRDRQLRLMDQALARVRSGSCELIWISGPPGVGKTVLAMALQDKQARDHVLVGQGDKLGQIRPYQPLLQAATQFVQGVMSLSDDVRDFWRKTIQQALGANAAVLVEAVPILGELLGEVAKVPQLQAHQSKNRFFTVFQQFLNCLARKEQALILVMDDFDQSDSASLELLEWILRQSQNTHLMVVATSQDDRETPNIPFNQFLLGVEEAGVPLLTVPLSSLDVVDLAKLIADSLAIPSGRVEGLAQVIVDKTHGNPFFVHQLLMEMHRQSLIWLDIEDGWQWHEEQLMQVEVTQNVVDFVLQKLKRLDEADQYVLSMAAALGNRFDASILAELPDLAPTLEDKLALFSQLELIHSEPDTASTYAFSHVRIRAAALSLQPHNTISRMHFELSQVFQVRWMSDTEVLNDLLFHLKAGMAWRPDDIDQAEACRWNLRAGRKAQASGANQAASDFLEDALTMFLQNWWQSDYPFAFELFLTAAECAYLSGRFDRAESHFNVLFEKVHSTYDHARVLNLKVVLNTHRDRSDQAVAFGLEALALLGVKIPRIPKKWQLGLSLIRIRLLLLRHRFKLTDMNKMADDQMALAMEICGNLQAPAYLLNSDLYGLVTFTMVEITLRNGIRSISSVAFINFAVVTGSALGNYQLGRRYARFALKWSTEFQDSWSRGRCQLIYGAVVNHWMSPAAENLDYLNAARVLNQESGDLLGASYASHFEMMTRWVIGQPLDSILERVSPLIQWTKSQRYTYYGLDAIAQMTRNYKGLTERFGSYTDDSFDEASWSQELSEALNASEMVLYRVTKMQAAYLAGDLDEAQRQADLTKPHIYSALGQLALPQYHLYGLLTLCARVEGPLQGNARKAASKHLATMKKWARYGPMNFSHLFHLMQAEWNKSMGTGNVVFHYDQAIQEARTHGFVQDEALAHERYGVYLWESGKSLAARAYLEEAIRLYRSWGAEAKCTQMKQVHKALKSASAARSAPTSIHTLNAEGIDLKTVLNGAQTLSGEMREDHLVETVLVMAMESAGAQMGALVFARDDQLQLACLIRGGKHETDQEQFHRGEALAMGPLHYAMRVRESLVLDDAHKDPRFANDPYLNAHQTHSLVCVPLHLKGQLMGFLYLENNAFTHAFTPARLGILEWLGTQAAISLEHARLYAEMESYSQRLEQRVAERTLVIEEKNQQILSSIRYAQRIQSSILPAESVLDKHFTDRFVIFRPRDLVSGDFFWLREAEGLLVGVVDCTGHGVPGAFLSLVGLSMLDQIASQTPSPNPASILTRLDALIRNRLKGGSDSDQPSEGMDVALCQWFPNKKTLIYAGAKRPLYLVRCQSDPPTLEEVKGDNRAIGGFTRSNSTIYENKTCQVSSGDMIYLTTDGFADQNDRNNKKYGSKALKSLLVQIATWDIASQRDALVHELNRHMGRESQRDDITLIGIRL